MALAAPNFTESMKVGLRLQKLIWNRKCQMLEMCLSAKEFQLLLFEQGVPKIETLSKNYYQGFQTFLCGPTVKLGHCQLFREYQQIPKPNFAKPQAPCKIWFCTLFTTATFDHSLLRTFIESQKRITLQSPLLFAVLFLPEKEEKQQVQHQLLPKQARSLYMTMKWKGPIEFAQSTEMMASLM